jgi:hypothetical protein
MYMEGLGCQMTNMKWKHLRKKKRKSDKEIKRMGIWRRFDEQMGKSLQKFEKCRHLLHSKVLLARKTL